MGWIEAIVLGVVQGLTEFLPVSSTAHVSLAGQLFFGADPSAAFSAVIQLGTTAAVLIYFIKDIWRIIKAWFLSLIGKVPRSDPDARLGWFIIVGSIPVAVLGLLFQNAISTSLRNLWVTVGMLFGVGIILWVADIYAARVIARNGSTTPVTPASGTDSPALPARARRGLVEDASGSFVPANEADLAPLTEQTGGAKTLTHMTWWDAIILGLCQAAALIPGVSRSGATTSAGLFLGYDRPSAARYSFLLSIPAVLASGLFELKDIDTTTISWTSTAVATGIAFVVGFAVIAWFLRFVSNHTFRAFAVYRIVIAIAIAALLLTGVGGLSAVTGV